MVAQGGRALSGIDLRKGQVVPRQIQMHKHEWQLLWKQAEARAGSCQSGIGNGFSVLIFLIFKDQRIS